MACPGHGRARNARSSQVGCSFQLQLEKLGTEIMLKRDASTGLHFADAGLWERDRPTLLCHKLGGRGAMETTKTPFPTPSDSSTHQTTDRKPLLRTSLGRLFAKRGSCQPLAARQGSVCERSLSRVPEPGGLGKLKAKTDPS